MHLTNRELATIIESLGYWEDCLHEDDSWIWHSSRFQTESPLTREQICDLMSRLDEATKQSGCSCGEWVPAWTYSLKIPTYLGHQKAVDESRAPLGDFTRPNTPVLIVPADGIRVVLGTHDYNDTSKPDIQVERRPHGWAIFVHPDAGDPVACLYMLDDGRTFLVPEDYISNPIQIVDDVPAELDMQ
jgi:hypothetical protein